MVLLVLVKVGWVFLFRVDAARLMAGHESADLLARRDYLLARFDTASMGVAAMPSAIGDLFQGEWAIGSHSMLVAALANLAIALPSTRAGSIPAAERLTDAALSASLRRFDRDSWREDPIDSLPGANGHAGYLGHTAFMMGACRFLGGGARFDDLHHRIVDAMARRVAADPRLCIETYPGETYVMDNLVVLAAIANHERLFGWRPERRQLVDRWLVHARSHLVDRRTGLLVFSLGRDGQPLSGSRGSGAGWASFYLPFVDERFAAEQFELVERHLVHRLPIGVTGILEYPRGVEGSADVDSGPVIFGLSTSGSGFAMAGARRHGRTELLDRLMLTAELAGFTVQWRGRRRYLLAPLVGDSIVLAMKTATAWPVPAGPGLAAPRR